MAKTDYLEDEVYKGYTLIRPPHRGDVYTILKGEEAVPGQMEACPTTREAARAFVNAAIAAQASTLAVPAQVWIDDVRSTPQGEADFQAAKERAAQREAEAFVKATAQDLLEPVVPQTLAKYVYFTLAGWWGYGVVMQEVDGNIQVMVRKADHSPRSVGRLHWVTDGDVLTPGEVDYLIMNARDNRRARKAKR